MGHSVALRHELEQHQRQLEAYRKQLNEQARMYQEIDELRQKEIDRRDRQIAQLNSDRARLQEEKWGLESKVQRISNLLNDQALYGQLRSSLETSEIQEVGADLKFYIEVPVSGFALLIDDSGEVQTARRGDFELTLTTEEATDLGAMYADMIASVLLARANQMDAEEQAELIKLAA